MFLVDVIVKPGNVIVVEIDSEQGIGIDDCATLSRKIEAALDRDNEDFELESRFGRNHFTFQNSPSISKKYWQRSGSAFKRRTQAFGDVERCQ